MIVACSTVRMPLQMVRAVGQDTFQPKIGFKTRYGLQANPFAVQATLLLLTVVVLQTTTDTTEGYRLQT